MNKYKKELLKTTAMWPANCFEDKSLKERGTMYTSQDFSRPYMLFLYCFFFASDMKKGGRTFLMLITGIHNNEGKY